MVRLANSRRMIYFLRNYKEHSCHVKGGHVRFGDRFQGSGWVLSIAKGSKLELDTLAKNQHGQRVTRSLKGFD